jgi:DMSO/TMAO reductase YedYZ molybdopterin-dependent catalytic subunit
VRRVSAALVGILVTGVALAAGQLAGAVVSPPSGPVTAVGQVAINVSPEWLKSFGIGTFGSNDKRALVVGIVIVLVIVAAALGIAAARRAWVGYATVGVLAALGVAAAVTRPLAGPSWAIPSIVAGLVGAGAFAWLSAQAEPAVAGSKARRAGVAQLDRRRFVRAAVLVGAGAAVGGVLSRWVSERKMASTSRAAVRIPQPASTAPPTPSGAQISVPGMTPFVTPNDGFYRVDTALFPPQVTAQDWRLRIHGMVDREVVLTYDQLLRRPLIERDVTLTCVSNPVGGQYIGNARWIGTPLKPLLEEAGVRPGADQIVSRSADGMTIGTPTAAAMDGRDAMLAVAMNGEPLPIAHGFPVRMVIPGLYGYVSATKWVVDLELTTFGAFDAYWVRQGWAQQATIKTESRIDLPRSGQKVSPGTVPVAGVAWAQHTGIERVEVRVDGGSWQQAELAAQDSVDTWRQWLYRWDATLGQHALEVRATDDTGAVQTGAQAPPRPNGATGWHRVTVTVA